MKHIHIDEFAKGRSIFHNTDPRAKVVAVFIFIFFTATMTRPLFLLSAVTFWTAVLLAAGIPLGYVLRRLTWIIPFAGFLIVLFPFVTPGDVVWTGQFGMLKVTATAQGIDRAIMLLLRVLSSVLGLITLMSTTRFNLLLKALSDLKVPGIIIQMVEFTIRYLFVSFEELKRMRRARKSRGFVLGKNIWHLHTLRTLSQMIGTMFLRAYERGDRVYIAMISRGFTGKVNILAGNPPGFRDYLVAGMVITVGAVLWLLDKGGGIK